VLEEDEHVVLRSTCGFINNSIAILDLLELAEDIGKDLSIGIPPEATDKYLAVGRVHISDPVNLLAKVGVLNGRVAKDVDELVLREELENLLDGLGIGLFLIVANGGTVIGGGSGIRSMVGFFLGFGVSDTRSLLLLLLLLLLCHLLLLHQLLLFLLEW